MPSYEGNEFQVTRSHAEFEWLFNSLRIHSKSSGFFGVSGIHGPPNRSDIFKFWLVQGFENFLGLDPVRFEVSKCLSGLIRGLEFYWSGPSGPICSEISQFCYDQPVLVRGSLIDITICIDHCQ